MILRWVTMTFRPEHREDFLETFRQVYPRILAQPGCRGLWLVQDPQDPNTFSTLSLWERVEDLEAYRAGDLFRQVWPRVKAWFAAPARAQTYPVVTDVGEEAS